MKYTSLPMKLLSVLCILIMTEGAARSQGFLRNSTTTNFSTGVTITEVAGWGNPPYDINRNGTFEQNSDEFTELTNTSNDTIDIGGWSIGDGGATYVIPANKVLYPGKKAIFFHGTGTGVTTGPTSFQAFKGDSNLNFYVQFSLGNGATNTDGIGIRNKAGLYIKWVTNGANLHAGIQTTGSPTLVGLAANVKPTVANPYGSPSASRQRASYSDTVYVLHPFLPFSYTWLDTSTGTSSRASAGRESNGRVLTPPDPSSAPTISFGTPGSDSIRVSALGNTLLGMRRMIVMRAGSAVNWAPTDGSKPSGINADFTVAADQGSGNKVVYDGQATSQVVNVINLSASTNYHFAVYEYNGNSPATDISYRTASNVATGNTTTAASLFPAVNISLSANTGSEAAATQITVTATAAFAVTGDQTIKVKMSGTNITAGDYSLSASDSNITIANGQTVGTLTLTISDDAVAEGPESGSVQIFQPSSGISIGATTTANLSITDNEPTVSVSASTNSTSEAVGGITIYAVTSANVTGDQTVNVAVTGTGITAGDYNLTNTVIAILSGNDSGFVTLNITDDNIRESSETYNVSISSPSSGISIASASTNIVVNDNDNSIVISSLNTNLPADTFDNVIATTGNSQMIRGWYFKEGSTNANTLYDTSSGSSTTGNTYSYGSFNSTERALGSLTSGSLLPVYFGAQYTNSTGQNINTLKISCIGEMWLYQGNPDKLDFQYSTNATNVYDSAATWIDANDLDFNNPNTTTGRLNGNSIANRTYFNDITITLNSVVANGGTFWIRYMDLDQAGGDAGLAIDSFVLQAKNTVITHFYCKPNSDLSGLGSWTDDITLAGGQAPSSFSDDAQIFHIQGVSSATIGADWTVSGAGSKVIVGDSLNPTLFTTPSSYKYVGTIDVKNLSTFTMVNSYIPNFGVLDSNSTVDYAQTTATTILNNSNYGNLKISGNAGTKTFTAGVTTVNNNLSLNNTKIDFPSQSTSVNLIGDILISGTLQHVDTTKAFGIVTVGNGNQTIFGSGQKLYIFRLTSNKSAGSFNLDHVSLRAIEDYRLTFTGSANFNDNGNDMWVGDDFQTDGSTANYILSGTIVMRAITGTGNIEQNTSGGTTKAELNHLIWNLTGSGAGSFSGSGAVYIKGDMTFTSINTGTVALGSNSFYINGNWNNNYAAGDVVSEGTSNVYMMGNTLQAITCAYNQGETFNKLYINNASGVNGSAQINMNDSLTLTTGVLTANVRMITASALIGRTSGWVNGSISKFVATGNSINVGYEVGNETKFLPVGITLNFVTNTGTLAVRSNQTSSLGDFSNVCIDSTKKLNRKWTLTKGSGLTFLNYNAAFTFTGSDTANTATQTLKAFADNGIYIEKANIYYNDTNRFAIIGDTLMGTILAGSFLNLTSTFNISNATPCLNGAGVTFTYTGNGKSTMNYAWTFGANSTPSTSSSRTPSVVNYSATGVKSLSLVVSGLGCVTSTTNSNLTAYQNGFTGAFNNSWSNPANWCSGAVPNSGSTVVLSSNVIINASSYVYNLTINTGDTLTINNGGNLIVNGDLVVNGYLKMNAGTITFTKNGTCIPAGIYHQLRVCAAGTVTACGNITVNHDLVICSGTTFNDGGFIISAKANVMNDGTHSTTSNGKIQLGGTSMQTIYGTSGIYGNLELNNSNGARLGANNSTTTPATINNTLRLVTGNLAINGNTLTIGSLATSTGTIVNTGSSQIIAVLPSAHLRLLGNGSAPQITNLRISTPGSVTVNLPNGVKLGTASSIYSSLTITNGKLDLNGKNLTIGSNSSSGGKILGNGLLTNTLNGGILNLLGNGSNSIYQLNLDSMFYVYINNPAGAIVNRNFVVNGIMTLNNGDVNLNGYTLTLSPTASISEVANQTFYGNTGMITTSRNLSSPLSNVNIGGMGLTLSTSAAPDNSTISRGHTVYTNGGSSIKRYFDITTTNSVTATNFAITYDSTELNGNVYNALRINSSTDGGNTWSNINGCIPSLVNSATGTVGRYGGSVILSSSTTKYTASDINNSLSPVFVNNNPITNISSEPTQVTNNIYTYPNPFTNEFTVELNVNAGMYTLQLTDLSGKSIYNQNIEANEGTTKINISTETLSKGIYILNVMGNEQKQMIKIVKQ